MALTTGLTAYYKLEDLTESVGGLTLTNHNTVTFSAGKVNNAANFVAASTQYLNRADNAAFQMGTGDFSLCAWIKFTSIESGGAYVPIIWYGHPSSAAGYSLSALNTSGSNVVGACLISDGVTLKEIDTDSTTLNDGAWHLLVATFDRDGNASLYLDGGAAKTTSIAAVTGSVNQALGFEIGSTSFENHLWNGSIDEVGVWNRVLTSGEVAELWNGGAGGTYPFAVNVTVNLTGVAADPQIGTGTVTIGSAAVTPPTEDLVPSRWFGLPEDEKVYLTGVSANPMVGRITPVSKLTREELTKTYPFPVRVEERPLRLVARKKAPVVEPPKPDAFVYVTGVHPVPKVGSGKVQVYYEDVDEELIGILELIA